MIPELRLLAPCLGAVLLAGCTRPTSPPAEAAPSSPFRFENVAASSGIRFTLGHQGRSPLTVLETAGGGAAFLDYDLDGHLDALLVGPGRVGLFRNRGDGTFEDRTQQSGLPARPEWMGCAVADYDGDRRPDVLLTGYQRTALFRNVGSRFQDVTAASGLQVPGWALSAAFADYDLDGRLDVYVTQYLEFDKSSPQVCQLGDIKTACGPEVYEPQHGLLFRNLGGGKFRNTTREAGLGNTHGKGWAALLSDFNGDRYPDLYVANDMAPCDFFFNRKGRFAEAGTSASVAYDANGHLLGAMGTDSADYDGDGDFDLLVTTYFAQSTCLYRNEGQSLFSEVGVSSGVGAPSIPYVGFGVGLPDLDNDTWPDVFLTNGHVRDNVKQHDAGQDYAQPMQLFQNLRGSFRDVSQGSGPPFSERLVGRGAAFGDYDNDGLLDILVCNLEGDAILLKNRTQVSNHWLRVRLEGTGGNTQGLGARVEVEHSGKRQVREVRTCGSVLSANEPVAHFGLGSDTAITRVTVTWPTGKKSVLQGPTVDQVLVVKQPA